MEVAKANLKACRVVKLDILGGMRRDLTDQ